MTFCDFEKGIGKNMFDLSFLDSYHSKLCCELMQPYDEKKKAVLIVFFTRKTGKTWHVPLLEII